MFDPSHPEWRGFVEKIEARIHELQVELENPLDLDTTNRARGAIGELRRIVSSAARIDVVSPPNYTA